MSQKPKTQPKVEILEIHRESRQALECSVTNKRAHEREARRATCNCSLGEPAQGRGTKPVAERGGSGLLKGSPSMEISRSLPRNARDVWLGES
jgi:hypothetical protein